MFLLLHLMFFSIIYFLCYDGKGENSAHTLSLATCSHRSLAIINGQRQVCFEGKLSLSSPFSLMFFTEYSLFCHGNCENSAHRLSLTTRSYHCLAITERQQWAYFEGKFSESSHFSVMVFKTSNYFQLNTLGPSAGWQ
jgi:hypothetical protein